MSGFVIEGLDLVKRYGDLTAVDRLSLQIPEGVCFGLLGPNGAGKSTTIEMLEGIRQPDAGEVRYRGRPLDAEFRLRRGIQFQSTSLIDFQTTREMLELFAAFYPVHRPLDELIARLQLEGFLDQYAMKLSGGQRQRLLLALALVNDPDIVFLDEPTTGLDPQARHNLWDLVRDIRREGKTVLLTTHYMDEAEYLCDTLAIMDHGRVIAAGEPKVLLREHFGELAATGVDIAPADGKAKTLEDLFLRLTGRALRE